MRKFWKILILNISLVHIHFSSTKNTVKFGYNGLGYNEQKYLFGSFYDIISLL